MILGGVWVVVEVSVISVEVVGQSTAECAQRAHFVREKGAQHAVSLASEAVPLHGQSGVSASTIQLTNQNTSQNGGESTRSKEFPSILDDR